MRWAWLVGALAIGCVSLPEEETVDDVGSDAISEVALDTADADSAAVDSALADTADSAVLDTDVPDSYVVDTAPETAPPADTSIVVDTSPPDVGPTPLVTAFPKSSDEKFMGLASWKGFRESPSLKTPTRAVGRLKFTCASQVWAGTCSARLIYSVNGAGVIVDQAVTVAMCTAAGIEFDTALTATTGGNVSGGYQHILGVDVTGTCGAEPLYFSYDGPITLR